MNFINRLTRHDIMTYSAALSFYFLQASIPLMMVLISVSSYFLEGNEEAIFAFVDFLPETTSDLIMRAVDILIDSSQSTAVTTITILFALWSATSGVNKLINAINHAYGLIHKKQAIKQRIMSIFFTLIFIFLIIFILIFQIYGKSILNVFNAQLIDSLTRHFNANIQKAIDYISSPIFRLITGIIPFLIMAVALGLFYMFAPSSPSNRIKPKEAFLGGLFATVAIFITTFIYSYFINNFSNQSLVYGALAGILALFIRLLLVATLLIIGAELIAAYKEGYKQNFFDKSMDDLKKSSSLRDKINNYLGKDNGKN